MRKRISPIYFSLILLGMLVCPSGNSNAADSLSFGGKGMYLWQLWSSHGGGKNLGTIVTKMKSIGATWVVIKMGDGDSYYNNPGKSLNTWAVQNYTGMDSVIRYFHAKGIKLLAFQYVYAEPHHWGNAVSETDVANMILSVPGIDGLLIDAEIEYDTATDRVAEAKAYCDGIHAQHPNSLVGLTSWDRINGHTTFPWTTFLERVDVNMPQLYWAARSVSPQYELTQMSSQFLSNTITWISQGYYNVSKPMMPIGQGETFGYGSDVAQGDISSFCTLSQTTYSYPGVSLWEYNQITHSYVWDEYAAAWQVTSVPAEANTPYRYNLSQNYPNPFNPTTHIRFEIPVAENVTLKIYDILGRPVAILVNGRVSRGIHEIEWKSSGMPSGTYFYRLQAGRFSVTKKLLLLR